MGDTERTFPTRGPDNGVPTGSVEMGQQFHAQDSKMTRTSVERIYEGKYVAEVSIDLIEGDTEWAPFVSEEDVLKLDRVRLALRRGDISAAAREAKVFELMPVSA
jgi:hypothetical protein